MLRGIFATLASPRGRARGSAPMASSERVARAEARTRRPRPRTERPAASPGRARVERAERGSRRARALRALARGAARSRDARLLGAPVPLLLAPEQRLRHVRSGRAEPRPAGAPDELPAPARASRRDGAAGAAPPGAPRAPRRRAAAEPRLCRSRPCRSSTRFAARSLGRGALLVPVLFAGTAQFHGTGLQPLVEPSLCFFVVLAFVLFQRRSAWQYAAAAAAAMSRYEAAALLPIFAAFRRARGSPLAAARGARGPRWRAAACSGSASARCGGSPAPPSTRRTWSAWASRRRPTSSRPC